MSGKKRKAPEANWVLIHPEDVKSMLRLHFKEENKHLQKENLTFLKNWVISRANFVGAYQCFLLLGLYCPTIIKKLTYDILIKLIESMIDCVQKCLSHTHLKKDNMPGKNCKWNKEEKFTYPMDSYYEFSLYENAISKGESLRITRLCNNDQISFIKNFYGENERFRTIPNAPFDIDSQNKKRKSEGFTIPRVNRLTKKKRRHHRL